MCARVFVDQENRTRRRRRRCILFSCLFSLSLFSPLLLLLSFIVVNRWGKTREREREKEKNRTNFFSTNPHPPPPRRCCRHSLLFFFSLHHLHRKTASHSDDSSSLRNNNNLTLQQRRKSCSLHEDRAGQVEWQSVSSKRSFARSFARRVSVWSWTSSRFVWPLNSIVRERTKRRMSLIT